MVTLMSEQSGRSESADRPRPGQSRGADRSGSGRPQQPGRRQPGGDVLTDLQRWLIRVGARNVRSQFEDQVRRTFSGQRPDNGDVWDIATTEIPSDVGEAPECQWCPICRAARRMRDSSPGLAGQLSGAGEVAASTVQDAIRAFDTFLTRAAGGGPPGSASGPGQEGSLGQARDGADTSGIEPDADPPAQPGASAAGRPDSLAGEHGPVGWKPGDRLATAAAAVADPWATATAAGEPAEGATSGGGTSDAGSNGSGSTGRPASGGPDGRGHGPSDRS